MITEGQKRDWWDRFEAYCWRKALKGRQIQSPTAIYLQRTLPTEYIYPTRLRDALKEFHRGKK